MSNVSGLITLLSFFFVASCRESDGESYGMSDTIRLFAWPDHPQLPQETIDAVSETFGMEVLTSNDWRDWNGSIAVYFTQAVAESGDEGWATGPSCSPHITLDPRTETVVVVHEVGHTLGLDHVDTPGNLMNVVERGFDLNDRQIETARIRAWEMEECRK